MKTPSRTILPSLLASAVMLFFALHGSARASEIVRAEISGMVCPMCAHNIEKSFQAEIKEKQLTDFSVDLDTKIVQFKMADGKALTDEVVREKIRDAGYVTLSIDRKKPPLDDQ